MFYQQADHREGILTDYRVQPVFALISSSVVGNYEFMQRMKQALGRFEENHLIIDRTNQGYLTLSKNRPGWYDRKNSENSAQIDPFDSWGCFSEPALHDDWLSAAKTT
ncbi:hypothetical protein [Larkinella knui]|uniref:Uncharacterized protein n=1 Tax=Larkinella knui TaxID=2025310 RepID=A0A3P1CF50_9BACT|nr:hypothetical protein [Larkinella knui]RRB11855.1 hypothetical protein EHT87_25660 [Larkinella knui]